MRDRPPTDRSRPAPAATPALRPGAGPVLALALTLAAGFTAAQGAEPPFDDWTGVRVMARGSDVRLKIGREVQATLTAGCVFRVDRAKGDWLWVDSGNIRGWVKKAEVVPLAHAVAVFTEAIRAEPENAMAYLSRGLARQAARDLPGAAADFDRALQLDPRNAWAFHDRATVHYARGDLDRALADAEASVRLQPKEPAHLANRGAVRFARKEFDRAVLDYSAALAKLDGGEAYLDDSGDEGESNRTRGRLWAVKWTCARAECWAALNAHEKALADYAEALRLDPNDFATVNSLAWLLATAPASRDRDGHRARELATRACTLTNYKNHLCLDTLAAAAAETGDFDDAVKWLTRALELTGGDPRFDPGYRARLALYRARQPYREPGPNP